MSEIQDHVSNLSQSIGPRPAGTEEEQQAALYIAEVFQKEAGLQADVEDFNFNPQYEAVRAVCCALAVIVALLAVFLPVMIIPAVIISLASAVVFALEVLGKPFVSRLFNQGISQNVVAKYQPEPSKEGQPTRRRKVVLVARYDSGKVRRDLSAPILSALPIIKWAELGGMVALPILTLIRFFVSSGAAASVVLNVLVVVAAVLAVLPLVGFLVRRFAPYNESANCNASGVAVMAEVATRLGRGRVASASDDQAAVIHGEQEARASGYVPEGADLVYETSANIPPNPPAFADESPEARLLAAKAAVAALSGKPVSNTINIDISSQLVQVKEPPLPSATADSMLEQREQTQAAFAQRDAAGESQGASLGEPQDNEGARAYGEAFGNASSGVPNGVKGSLAVMQQAASLEGGLAFAEHEEGEKEVPDWFKRAQKNAKKTAPEQPSPSQRSRYAGALAAAEREIAAQAQSNVQQGASETVTETEQRLLQMRSNILQAQPPQFEEPEMRKIAEAGRAEMAASATEDAASAGMPADARIAAQGGAQGDAPAASAGSAGMPAQRAVEKTAGGLAGEAPAVPASPSPAAAGGTVAFSPVGLDLEELRREIKEQQQAVQDEALAFESLYAAPSPHAPSSVPSSTSTSAPSVPVPSSAAEGTAAPSSASASEVRASIAASIPSIAMAVEAESASEEGKPTQGRISSSANPLESAAAPLVSSTGSSPAQPAAASTQSSTARKKPTPRKKRSITLPSLTGSFAPLEDHRKQEAPLAQDAELSSGRSSLLRRSVPSVPSVGSPVATNGNGSSAKESLRAVLPSLSGVIREQNEQNSHNVDRGRSDEGSSREGSQIGLDSSAAGNLSAASTADETIAINVNQAGAFASVGATGAFAPVGDELLEDVDPQDVYVDDADDSAYEEQYTETGAFAGPGYVEMPKSRASRFFGRFRSKKKKEQDEATPQEWLNVDEGFDARSVGKARGGWESFRQDDEPVASSPSAMAPIDVQAEDVYDDYEAYDGYGEYDDYDDYDYGYDNGAEEGFDDDYGTSYEPASTYDGAAGAEQQGTRTRSRRGGTWNGGAFSRESLTRMLPKRKKRGPVSDEAPEFNEFEGEAPAADDASYGAFAGDYATHGGYDGNGGYDEHDGYNDNAFATSSESSSEAYQGAHMEDDAANQAFAGEAMPSAYDMDDVHAENIQRIYGFRHANVTTEVWFVALGAQLAANAGMEAFINEHAEDLRGAVIIDLDGLGAGDLSLIDREGAYRTVKGSSRMKRYVRKASVALGMEVGSATMTWADSAAACAMKRGHQAMHLAGMRDGKPAYFGEADDVQANVSEETMLSNADFVMEILKNV